MGLGSSKDFSPDVIQQGDLFHKELGKVFCVLTQSHFFVFPSKRSAFKDPNSYKIKLPTYDLVASVVEKSTAFLLRTSQRLIFLRATKDSHRLRWISNISLLLRSSVLQDTRRKLWETHKRLALHVHIIEAFEMSGQDGQSFSCQASIDRQDEFSEIDSDARFLQSFEKEKIVQNTPSAECSDGIAVWAHPLTIVSVDESDELVISVIRGGKKEIGKVCIPVSSMDLGGNGELWGTFSEQTSMTNDDESKELSETLGKVLEATLTRNSSSDEDEVQHDLETQQFEQIMRPRMCKLGRQKNLKEIQVEEEEELSFTEDFGKSVMSSSKKALGMHKWLDIKSAKGNIKGRLHIAVRVQPSHQISDLSTSSTEFFSTRNELLCSSQYWRDDLTFSRNLRVFIGSWNVGNARPADNLADWLPKASLDVLVFGAQECKYEAREEYSSCKEDWASTLKGIVPDDFTMLEYVSLWEIRLAVFVRDEILPEIRSVKTATEATGIAGVLGNKGGTLISFFCRNTSLCFINSHLAAHQHKTKKRNENVYEITGEIKDPCARGADLPNSFDALFWMGDLNYRLDFGDQGEEKTPSQEQFDEMVQKISNQHYDELYEYDQLQKEMHAKRVFTDFEEGEPMFEPTFKVVRNQRLQYNSQRSPAWCDRILWKSPGTCQVRQKRFSNVLQLKSSDHKPVYSVFSVESFYFRSARDLRWDSAVVQLTDFELDMIDESKPKQIRYRMHCPAFKEKSIEFTQEQVNKSEISNVALQYTSLPRLMRFFVVIEVLSSPEGLLGVAQLGLSSIMFKPADYFQPLPFKVLATVGTRSTARLRGSINIKWNKDLRIKTSMSNFSY